LLVRVEPVEFPLPMKESLGITGSLQVWVASITAPVAVVALVAPMFEAQLIDVLLSV